MDQPKAAVFAAVITAAAIVIAAVISKWGDKIPLAGIGLVLAWSKLTVRTKRILLALAIIAAVGIAVYLLWPRAGDHGWGGEWKISSQGKVGILQGRMTLSLSDDDSVTGHYTNSVDQDTISGTVAGLLSDDGRTLRGTWLNDRGLEGRFLLTLGQGDTSFQGSYSMLHASPEQTPQNWWKGMKVK